MSGSRSSSKAYHRMLYENLQLLSYLYPMSSSLKACIKEEIFYLPNMEAFQQVVFYFLNIIDPNGCKETFKLCWPVLDKKMEFQFRKIVANKLSELKAVAQIPMVTTSMLLSPGGDKLCLVLLKLAEYAIRMHMERAYGVKKETPAVSKELQEDRAWNRATRAVVKGMIVKEAQELGDRVSRVSQHISEAEDFAQSLEEMWRKQKLEIQTKTEMLQEIASRAPGDLRPGLVVAENPEPIEDWKLRIANSVEENSNKWKENGDLVGKVSVAADLARSMPIISGCRNELKGSELKLNVGVAVDLIEQLRLSQQTLLQIMPPGNSPMMLQNLMSCLRHAFEFFAMNLERGGFANMEENLSLLTRAYGHCRSQLRSFANLEGKLGTMDRALQEKIEENLALFSRIDWKSEIPANGAESNLCLVPPSPLQGVKVKDRRSSFVTLALTPCQDTVVTTSVQHLGEMPVDSITFRKELLSKTAKQKKVAFADVETLRNPSGYQSIMKTPISSRFQAGADASSSLEGSPFEVLRKTPAYTPGSCMLSTGNKSRSVYSVVTEDLDFYSSPDEQGIGDCSFLVEQSPFMKVAKRLSLLSSPSGTPISALSSFSLPDDLEDEML